MVKDHTQVVDMTDVVGNIALDYNLPYITLENLVELGKHAKRVYDLDNSAKNISFSEFCDYIALFVSTPFGKKVYQQLAY